MECNLTFQVSGKTFFDKRQKFLEFLWNNEKFVKPFTSYIYEYSTIQVHAWYGSFGRITSKKSLIIFRSRSHCVKLKYTYIPRWVSLPPRNNCQGRATLWKWHLVCVTLYKRIENSVLDQLPILKIFYFEKFMENGVQPHLPAFWNNLFILNMQKVFWNVLKIKNILWIRCLLTYMNIPRESYIFDPAVLDV